MTAAREGFIKQKERYPVIKLIHKNLERQPSKSLNIYYLNSLNTLTDIQYYSFP